MSCKLAKKIDNDFERLEERTKCIRILSGNAVKILAIISMFIDHFSKTVLEWISINIWFPLELNGQMSLEHFHHIDYFIRFTLYGIGTIAFPLFCLLLAEGFFYTKNRKRYFLSMAFFAIISELPFDLAFFSRFSTQEGTYPFYWEYQNVFFTLLLGLTALWCIEKFRFQPGSKSKKATSLLLQIISIVVITEVAHLIRSDYGSMGVLFIVGFYIIRKNRFYQILMFLFLYILTTGNQPPIYIGISCLIMLLYNGKRGKMHIKYLFYAFYPVHLAILYIITIVLAAVFLR